jgi:hypothetical protein
MIATAPQPSHHPGKTTLNEPTLGLRSKAWRNQRLPVHLLPFRDEQSTFGEGERMDSLHDPAQVLFSPGQKRPTIMTIAPHELHPGKGLLQRRQQGSASELFGSLGTRHLDSQQMALRIHERMANASPDFFPHVLARFRTTHGAGFDRLTVNDGRAWLFVSALPGGHPHAQRLEETIPDSFPLPPGYCLCR